MSWFEAPCRTCGKTVSLPYRPDLPALVLCQECAAEKLARTQRLMALWGAQARKDSTRQTGGKGAGGAHR